MDRLSPPPAPPSADWQGLLVDWRGKGVRLSLEGQWESPASLESSDTVENDGAREGRG